MTCIIGLEHNGKVYIGADSSAVDNWEMHATRLHKVFRRGPFLIGYTSSFRMGQILQYQVEFPKAKDYDEAYMVKHFTEACRLKFKELGYSKVENNQEEGGDFLVGVQGRLFLIADDFQVNSYQDGLVAIGLGRPYALAAMLALADQPAKLRIARSLEIAEYFCNGVKGPFVIMRT